ncbi:MAG: toxin C-terminal domain-containing protein [Lactovum sp.]
MLLIAEDKCKEFGSYVGIWKMADSVKNLGRKTTRLGTSYNENLQRIGD